MKRADIQKRIQQLGVERLAREMLITGVFSLYEHAVIVGDVPKQDLYRQQIHDLMDAKLDSLGASAMLLKALVQAEE